MSIEFTEYLEGLIKEGNQYCELKRMAWGANEWECTFEFSDAVGNKGILTAILESAGPSGKTPAGEMKGEFTLKDLTSWEMRNLSEETSEGLAKLQDKLAALIRKKVIVTKDPRVLPWKYHIKPASETEMEM